MSHQVIISYEGVSIQIQAQCETAVASLCKIDKTIAKIRETAKTLRTEEVREYERYLLKSKEEIARKIEAFKASLVKYQSMTTRDEFEYRRTVDELRRQASDLSSTVATLTGSKLQAIEAMIREGLLEEGNAVFERMRAEESGMIAIGSDVLERINAIEDVSLRQLALLEANSNKGRSFDTIMEAAQARYDELLERSKKGFVEEAVADMRSKGVDEGTISRVVEGATTIDEISEQSSAAITDERVRKETLKVIIKAIKARGFIVDTQHNLKIDRERNVVHLVALKASGQKAEFEIQLSGKFMYRFDGYEGQACKKDIEPFMSDLASIYDINVLHEEVVWDNPDKIQMQQHQTYKTKKS
jgi:hypothetical protein